MALSKILENSIAAGAVAASKLKDFTAAVDLNGVELLLDADQDTSITADTDDQIDIKISGADDFRFTANTFTALSGSTIAAQALTATTIGASGVVTANAGVVVDNITIDGQEIDVSSGDLTLDVAGDIILDAAGNDFLFKAGGTTIATHTNSSSDYVIQTAVSDKDFIIKGNDGGATITPLTLDMSAGGDLFLTGGLIDLKNDGSAVSNIKFYCESSNAHAQTLIGAPHSESADNVLTLPGTGGDARLVSTASTATLTNKTLTSPKINEDVAVTATATELNLLDGVSGLVQADLTKLAAIDATATELNLIDGGATVGTTAIADGDGLLINDAGTMRVSTVQTLAAYLDDEITAMPNLTSVGTLTALTVDDVVVDGKVITMTGSSGDTFVTTVGTNGATSLVTVDTAAAAAHLTITADGTVDINSAGVLTLDSGAAINIEPASGSAILLDGTISIDAGVVTGATSVTSTAFVGGLTGNVTGNASGTALTVTQAAQTAITSVGTLTSLTTSGVLDLTGTTDASDASGDTGILRVEGGASIAKKLYIGTDLDVDGTANLDIVDIDGAVNIAAAVTQSGGVFTQDGGAVFNEASADVDFRVESNGQTHMFFVDGGNNKIGIGTLGTTAPDGIVTIQHANTSVPGIDPTNSALHIHNTSGANAISALTFTGGDHSGDGNMANIYVEHGNVTENSESTNLHFETSLGEAQVERLAFNTTEAVFNNDSKDLDFRVESDNFTHALFVQGSDGFVGINDSSPGVPLDITHATNNGIRVTSTSGHSLLNLVSDGTTYNSQISFGDDQDAESGVIKYVHDGDTMRFHVGGSGSGQEQLRMDSYGAVMIGTTTRASSHHGLQVSATQGGYFANIITHSQADGPVLMLAHNPGQAANNACVSFRNNIDAGIGSAVEVGTIKTDSNATDYNTSSDYRLKTNINYDWDATSIIKELKPAVFSFIADVGAVIQMEDFDPSNFGTSTHLQLDGTNNSSADAGDSILFEDDTFKVQGFIAHEVDAVVTQAIDGDKDAMTKEKLYSDTDDLPDGKSIGDVKEPSVPDMQGIDQGKLVALLCKTIQELEARITALEA